MKTVLLLALAFSASAFATPEFNARKTRCAEMQEAVEQNGVAKIRTRGLLLPRTVYAYAEPRCSVLEVEKEVVVRSADVFSCVVGLTCESDRSLRGDCYPGNNPGRCL